MKRSDGAGTLRLMKFLKALPLAVALSHGITEAETHRFTPTSYYTTFSAAHPPVLRIRPGDRVVTTTVDAAGYDADTKMITAPGNPQTGPFYIEGAEPGDTLVVTLERIRPNRKFAFSLDILAPYTVDPGFLRSANAEQGTNIVLWEIDEAAGVARLSSDAEAVRRFEREASRSGFMRRFGYRVGDTELEVPLAPMLGCLGTAPAGKQAIRSGVPARHGGNMDYAGTVEGVRVMLPVSEPGALFFLGDGHAKQGHGELVGTGVEVSMDVEFSVDLIKGKAVGWPRMENEEFLMVLGSARPLLQALQHATTELQAWLMNDYGYDERASSLLMGQVLEYEIANVVDPNFTVVAKIRKSLLRPSPNLPR